MYALLLHLLCPKVENPIPTEHSVLGTGFEILRNTTVLLLYILYTLLNSLSSHTQLSDAVKLNCFNCEILLCILTGVSIPRRLSGSSAVYCDHHITVTIASKRSYVVRNKFCVQSFLRFTGGLGVEKLTVRVIPYTLHVKPYHLKPSKPID